MKRPLQRRAERRDTFRMWRSACAQANEAYARWAADPSRDTYEAYMEAESRATRAGFLLAARRNRARGTGLADH